MAITSEQIWSVPSQVPRSDEVDGYVFGEPARAASGWAADLAEEIDWDAFRSAISGFFDERDPTCSIWSTIAKMAGVVGLIAGVLIAALALLGSALILALRAILG